MMKPQHQNDLLYAAYQSHLSHIKAHEKENISMNKRCTINTMHFNSITSEIETGIWAQIIPRSMPEYEEC